MSKMKQFFHYDAWTMLLDIVVVNAAYFLALCIRFYINFQFTSNIGYYMEYYFQFVPFNTVICLAVFFAFKLYRGMWIFAGLNDMNRIIGACIVTTILHILGTMLFIARMPTSYYIIGSFLQFMGITLIRFSYRFIQMEKRRIGKRQEGFIPAMVVGSGDFGRKVVHHLEENTPYRAVVIAGKDNGRFMNGIPVVALSEIPAQLKAKEVKAVYIADKELTKDERETVNKAAEGLELQDFTGQLSNLSGFVPLSALMEIIKTPLTVYVDGTEMKFADGMECLSSLDGEYEVLSVEANKISIRKAKIDDSWMKVYQEQTGQEVSFF